MNKLFKNPIFMFILGVVLATSITGVVAVNVISSNISYNDTTVEAALDDLYTKATTYKKLSTPTSITSNKILSGNSAYDSNGTLVNGSISTYTPTTVTPTTSSQTLETNGKYVNGNITIGAIPSSYKNLSSNTTVNSQNLLSGETAYRNDGTLITGSLNINDCVKDTFLCGTNCANSTGQKISGINFDPVSIQVYGSPSDLGNNTMYYNKNTNSVKGIFFGDANSINNGNNSLVINISDFFTYKSGYLYIKNFAALGTTMTYIACK